jgi:hypothetical protein
MSPRAKAALSHKANASAAAAQIVLVRPLIVRANEPSYPTCAQQSPSRGLPGGDAVIKIEFCCLRTVRPMPATLPSVSSAS